MWEILEDCGVEASSGISIWIEFAKNRQHNVKSVLLVPMILRVLCDDYQNQKLL